MAGFRDEQVAFEAPEGWEDKTIVAFAAPAQPGKFSPNIVMTRDVLKPGETLRSYSDRQIMELARRLEGFDLIESSERTVGGVTALDYRFAWRSDHTELHQHTVILAPASKVLTFTGTATHESEADLEVAMERVLAGVSFPNAAPAPYSPSGSGGGAGGGGWSPAGGGWTPTGRT